MIKLKFLAVFSFALLLYSCQYTDDTNFQYNVGNDFVTDPVKIIMIDTLTVKTYTTAVDSVNTSRNNRFMVGRAENENVITTCESYFRFDPAVEYSFIPSTVFESASMIFNLDGYSFGDTTKICKLEIYRLTEDITVDKETEYIYNSTKFAHEATPLATFTVDLNDDKLDSVVVDLPKEFGKELFDLAYNNDTILADADQFKAKYKGFLIKPSDDNISCVVGFIANPDTVLAPRIKIRYHDNTIDDNQSFSFEIEKYQSLSSSGSTANVNYYGSNYFKNDYSKLIGKDFPTGEGKISSKETGNMTFLQAGLNLKTRIEIPTINNLYYLGIGSVIKAELLFEPVEGTYTKQSDLPSTLEMYLVDKKNVNYGQMAKVGSSDMAYAVLHYNNEFKSQTYYSFDITKYVVDEYLDLGDPKYSLLMTMKQSDINTNVDQLIIGDQNHPTNKMKLKVYLATY